MANKEVSTTQEKVNQYILLKPLFDSMYTEVRDLSKKKQDSPLNPFKIKKITSYWNLSKLFLTMMK